MVLVSGWISSQISLNSARLFLRSPAEKLSKGKEMRTSWAIVTNVWAFLRWWWKSKIFLLIHYFTESDHGGTEVWATAGSVNVGYWASRLELMLSVRLRQSRVSAAPEGDSFWAVFVTNRWKTKKNNCFLFSAGLPSNTVTVHVEEHKPQTIHTLFLPSSSLDWSSLTYKCNSIHLQCVCWLLMEPNEG